MVRQHRPFHRRGWLKPGDPVWYNAGIYIFKPTIFDYTARLQKSPRGEYELTDAIIALVGSGHALAGLEIQGRWGRSYEPWNLFPALGSAIGYGGPRADLLGLVFGLALLPALWRRLPWSLAVYGTAMVFLPLSTGSLMSHYEFMHWPGVDKLSRHVEHNVTIKQATSVADQLGKEKAMCETFGCIGNQSSYFHRKWIMDWQGALGINFVNSHLSLYSMKGIAD